MCYFFRGRLHVYLLQHVASPIMKEQALTPQISIHILLVYARREMFSRLHSHWNSGVSLGVSQEHYSCPGSGTYTQDRSTVVL